jgi:hypothetical protein
MRFTLAQLLALIETLPVTPDGTGADMIHKADLLRALDAAATSTRKD